MRDGEARWVVAESHPRAAQLASQFSIRPLTAQLLLNRGIVEPADVRRFLDPRLANLRRPDGDWAMSGFDCAVSRLERAVVDGETIGLFGDYDVDGITSCALLTTFLREVGGRVVPRIARRYAGYGFGVDDVRAFADAAAQVIVTCDCGTSDHEALAAARASRIDVIVVDHHQVPERVPDALALLNPHQSSCRFPYKGLASVGVAFYLAAALRTRLRAIGRSAIPDPRDLLDLVAVGTIQDLAPLTNENRVLVHAGLRELARGKRPGLRALAQLAGLTGPPQSVTDVSFKIGPRLNAPGRLGDAQISLDLLLAEDERRAFELAQACETANQERREIQGRIFEEAIADVEASGPGSLVLVARQGWHPGVMGIVAAKLVERYGRPAVAIALDGARGVGSGRGVAGFHFFQAFRSCADLLVRYGGHAAAAGCTVEEKAIASLTQRLSAEAQSQLGDRPVLRELTIDAEVLLRDIDQELAEELQRLEPFGMGNPEPCFGARGVLLERTRIVGERHLQVTLRDRQSAHDGIGFGLASQNPGTGARVRAAFLPVVDTWRGQRRLQVRIQDLSADGDVP